MVRKQGLTPRKAQFVKEYRKQGGDVEKVALSMGVKPNYIIKMLCDTKVKKELANTVNLARERIAQATPNIIDGLLEMYGNDTVPPNVRANIGLSLLDRAGLNTPKTAPIQVNINTTISERARELLSKRLEPVTIDVEPIPTT